ncbi:MAG: Rid family detoxifying hydrolase [Planctomycetota bacterium]|nr:Rid family detoxifying hydrolase [Planctomycetota bacterium]
MADFEIIRSPQAPEAIGPYQQALAYGNLVFCSGQIPLVPGTKDLVSESIEAATRQVLCNVRAVLAAAGCGFPDVIKATVFLIDLNDFQGMNGVFSEFFGAHKPARSTVQVAKLPAGARVEIEVVAVRRG